MSAGRFRGDQHTRNGTAPMRAQSLASGIKYSRLLYRIAMLMAPDPRKPKAAARRDGRRYAGNAAKYSDEQIMRILERHKQGASLAVLEREFSIKAHTLKNWTLGVSRQDLYQKVFG